MDKRPKTLVEFVELSVRKCRDKGYYPARFQGMWDPQRAVPIINKLVHPAAGEAGFERTVKEGLKDWTLEAAVLAYPEEGFDPLTVATAKMRMGVQDA